MKIGPYQVTARRKGLPSFSKTLPTKRSVTIVGATPSLYLLIDNDGAHWSPRTGQLSYTNWTIDLLDLREIRKFLREKGSKHL